MRQVSWLQDRPTCHTFPLCFIHNSGSFGFRPLLQWRDRAGLSPASLLSLAAPHIRITISFYTSSQEELFVKKFFMIKNEYLIAKIWFSV